MLAMKTQVARFKNGNLHPLHTELWYVVKWSSNGFSYRARLNNLTLTRSPWNHNVCADFDYAVERYDLETGSWCTMAQ